MQHLWGREEMHTDRASVGNLEGKRTLGRPRRKWKDITMEDMDWIHMAQDRDRWRALVNAVMNFRVP
jgi:hypothetical protein